MLFFIFFYQLNIIKNGYIKQILFYFYVTCLIYKKGCFNIQFFYWQNEKGKEEKINGKKFDLPPWGVEPQIFE